MNMAVNPIARGPNMPGGPWTDPKYQSRVFFAYESDTTASLAATTGAATLTFNIAGDSDFFWTKFCAFALVGSVGTTRLNDQLPGVTMLLVNTTTGRQYSSN